MPDDLDVNRIASNVAVEIIRKSYDATSKGLSKLLRDSWARLFEDFKPYLEETYRRNNYVKIISSKDKPVLLYDIYVNSVFSCNNVIYSDNELIDTIRHNKRIVIIGNGGAGKTFFLKYLWTTIFTESFGRLPIFIELRKVNDLTSLDIESFVRVSLTRNDSLSESVFREFCKYGKFIFVFDGFDEVALEKREGLERQIAKFSSQNIKCGFVVSSRKDDRFGGWQEFQIFESEPFQLKQVRSLVQKIEFDKKTKSAFRKKLNSEFFEKHNSFLSNPLLAIMMLMTFHDNADIPNKMHIFYENVYQTLYQWHDATKESFSRKKCLDIVQFKRIFSLFCLFTYHYQKTSFTYEELEKFVNKAIKYQNADVRAEELIDDIVESVNLIQKDGLYYVFVHRSFQEYFCAFCITNITNSKSVELIQSYADRTYDNVFIMAHGISPDVIERDYFIHFYRSNLDLFPAVFTKKKVQKLINDLDLRFNITLVADGGDGEADGVRYVRFIDKQTKMDLFMFYFARVLIKDDSFGIYMRNLGECYDEMHRLIGDVVPIYSNLRVSGHIDFHINPEGTFVINEVNMSDEQINAKIENRFLELSALNNKIGLQFIDGLKKLMSTIRVGCEELCVNYENKKRTIDDILEI